MDANGGPGIVTVTTTPECAWNASSSANWISGVSPSSGQGKGDVKFTVAANDSSAARDGDIIVNDIHARVSQRAPCRYDVQPPTQSLGISGGAGTVTITTTPDCAWTATTDANWIALTPPVTGSGNATLNFTVAASNGNERTGTITIAGQQATVKQTGTAACTYSIAPTTQNIGAAGGAGGPVTVTTQGGCRWAATSNASWLSVTSGQSGTGSGSVGFSAAANTGAARTGTMTIAGSTFTVNQAGAAAPACAFTLSATGQNAAATASSGSVNVTTTSACAWTASSNASWITISSGASGSGNGSVAFNIAANAGALRTGTLTIAGQTYTVTQAAAAPSCAYTLSATSQNAPATASSGSVTVTTTGGCAWTAASNASWITVTSGATGSGNGTVAFSIAANTGAARTGTLTIAAQTYTVTQAAPPPSCAYTIAPTSQNVTAVGIAGTVTVTTTAACTWTATSNAAWITVTSGASGTGNGAVGFAVAANTGAARSGTISIADQTFTVTQDAVAPVCSYTIAPTTQNKDQTGGVGTVTVTTQGGCTWTAVSNASWITVTGGASGTGNGTVTFVIASNSGSERTGTLTIAGQTATVQQASGN